MTESQRLLANGQSTHTVEDTSGRNIEVRKLSRRESMRLMRQWGPACNVEAWFSLALLAASVRSIDGKPIPSPNTAEHVEAVADLLGEEGTKAVGEWYLAQQSEDLGEIRTAAKN